MLALEDLKGFNEKGVKEHISEQYAGDKCGFDYGCPTDKDALKEELEDYTIHIAYESVGACDSSSYFLMEKSNKYYEFSGSHCSCYVFEGQYDPQEATLEYLKSSKFWICTGGYDNNSDENERKVREYIKCLKYLRDAGMSVESEAEIPACAGIAKAKETIIAINKMHKEAGNSTLRFGTEKAEGMGKAFQTIYGN